MVMDRVLASKVTEGSGIQYKENRSQNRSMWDSTADKQWGRTTGFNKYSLSYVWEVRREPVESSTVYARNMFKTLENGMQQCVKGS